MVENSFFDQDPFLFDPASYWEFRHRARELRSRWYGEVLERARRLRPDPLFETMAALLASSRSAGGPDFYFSRTLSGWIAALEGALVKIERGEDPILLDIYFDADTFDRDLATEYPHLGLAKATVPFEVVHGSVAVVPVYELTRSPHMVIGVRPTFPKIDWSKTPFDRATFERGVRHLDESLSVLRSVSEGAYRSFKDNVHSMTFHVLEEDATSTSSRATWPGCIMMGLSRQHLERNDVAFTASLLYHEHAHNKLALYFYAEPAGLDPAEQFVSPFKNTCRSAEVILQQIYPITVECAVRLALLGADGREPAKSLEHLVATASRMRLLLGFLPLIEANPQCRATIGKLALFSQTVLAEIDRLVATASPELVQSWERDRERVNERHAWDIGQSLVRGAPVRDPGLDSWQRDGDRVRYVYRGVERSAVPEAGYGLVESRYSALDR